MIKKFKKTTGDYSMDILYHPVSGERMFAYTEDENRIIQAVLSDFKETMLDNVSKPLTRTVRGVCE